MSSPIFDHRTGAALRRVSLLGVSSVLSGLIVGGILGRVAMRVSAIAAGPEAIGDLTTNGNRIGDITVAGTLALVLFVGGLGGLVASALFVGSDPWLTWTGPARGLGFGLVAIAVTGGGDPFDSTDFLRLDPAALNVAMFVGLFIILGLGADLLFRVLDRRVPAATGTHQMIYLALCSAGVIPVAIVIGLFTVPSFCGCTPDYLRLTASLTMLLAAIAHHLATTIWKPQAWLARAINLTGYGALLTLLLAGLSQTSSQIGQIMAS